MLTFLELHQTLLGFVFFKLYTDLGLIYPPPLDATKDEGAAGVGAYNLQEMTIMQRDPGTLGESNNGITDATGKKISGKDVRKTIKTIAAAQGDALDPVPDTKPDVVVEEEEEFVAQPSTSSIPSSSDLPTLKSLTELPSSVNAQLFAPYTFFLSRETPRPLLEFVLRAFGGRVGWTPSQGGGSPIQEDDETITHVIVDRPAHAPVPSQDSNQIASEMEIDPARDLRRRRKYVQPQWVVDCVNKGKLLLEGPYEKGKTLPPHLSPFSQADGAYDPEEAMELEHASERLEDEDESEGEEDIRVPITDPEDPSALRVAELEAEAAGVDFSTFEKTVKKHNKSATKVTSGDVYVISVSSSATILINIGIGRRGRAT